MTPLPAAVFGRRVASLFRQMDQQVQDMKVIARTYQDLAEHGRAAIRESRALLDRTPDER